MSLSESSSSPGADRDGQPTLTKVYYLFRMFICCAKYEVLMHLSPIIRCHKLSLQVVYYLWHKTTRNNMIIHYWHQISVSLHMIRYQYTRSIFTVKWYFVIWRRRITSTYFNLCILRFFYSETLYFDSILVKNTSSFLVEYGLIVRRLALPCI